ncbi:uncharacterized protein [Nicotiana tomentosiformis]|uniref:uncharacterized protein n=1 Tax=Nicotiana tomentosiformis TaxID=4098 RepID=UPI00388C51F6
MAERRRSIGVHQVDTNTSVQVQLDAIAKEIRKLTLASIHNKPHASCDICGRGHLTHECQASMEEVNAVGNYNFNAMGQKHPRPQFQPQQPIQSGLEDLMKSFIVKIYERLDAHGATIKELGTCLHNLERQVRQIATILSERIPKKRGKELKIEDDKKTEKKKGKKVVEIKKEEETSRKEESEDVNVNLPFTEVLSQMPAYAKFLKEILTKKRKIEETLVVKLTEHCSAILQNKLPQKKLEKEIGEIRSVPISLQLADQMTITPRGIVEDILVREDKFVFPVDFIVVNMEENKKVPLILGRPFLATGRAILDIHDRKLMLRVGEETVTFEMNVATGVKKERPLQVLSRR